MTESSKRGRPPSASGNDARTLIIESTLTVLRSRPNYDVQRQEIAAAAGVTPALVSYYFPERWDLIYLASHKIMREYADELVIVTSRSMPTLEDLMSLIDLYVRFNMSHGHVFDFYVSSLEKTRRDWDSARFASIYRDVVDFLRRLIQGKHIREVNPVLFQSSLWSVSRYLSQNFGNIPGLFQEGCETDASVIAKEVFDMVVRGVAA